MGIFLLIGHIYGFLSMENLIKEELIEKYMKHVVTDLNDPNEPVMFNNSILGNYSYDTFFGNYTYEISSFVESNTQSEILHCTQIVEPNSDIVDQTNITSSVQYLT
jgi:hypothetical protein